MGADDQAHIKLCVPTERLLKPHCINMFDFPRKKFGDTKRSNQRFYGNSFTYRFYF